MTINLDNAPCYYFSSNDEGIILDANEKICSQLEYTKEELLGNKVEAIFTMATRIFYQTHFFPLLKIQNHAEEIFITLQTKSKKPIPVLLNTDRRENNGKAVIQYIAIPVHNRKKYEDELVAAKKVAEVALQENTALQQAKQELQKHTEQLDMYVVKVKQQNEELRQFNWVVTHDLQEPLRKISLFSNLLINASENFGNSKTIVEKLLRSSDQLRFVISGLQQYVWLTESTTNRVEIDFNKLLWTVQQKLKNEFPNNSLTVRTADLPIMQADWDQMQLVLHQLLSNAIRFCRKGEEAIVDITSTIFQKNRFTNIISKYKYQDFLKLQIKDNTIGFDSKYKKEIFDLSKSLQPASVQSIGLSICKRAIENHQGTITIDNNTEGGTTVTILLPMENNEKRILDNAD